MTERRTASGRRRPVRRPVRRLFPAFAVLTVLAVVFMTPWTTTLRAQDEVPVAEPLRYRHYYTPRTWIADFLAGTELYLPVRPEEFQRWIGLLQSETKPRGKVSPGGDRLVRCILEATFSENRFIDGTGRFEFRAQNVPPTRFHPAKPTRIDFSPLDIWIGDPRWGDGTSADILTTPDGATTLREYGATAPKLYPVSLAAGIEGPGMRERRPRFLRKADIPQNTTTPESPAFPQDPLSPEDVSEPEDADTPEEINTTESTSEPENMDEPEGVTVPRSVRAILGEQLGENLGDRLPLEFLFRNPPARLLPSRLAARNRALAEEALTFQWSLSGQDDALGNHVFQFALPPSLTLELRLAVPESLRPVCPGALVFEETEAAAPLHKIGTPADTTESRTLPEPDDPVHSKRTTGEETFRLDPDRIPALFPQTSKILGFLVGSAAGGFGFLPPTETPETVDMIPIDMVPGDVSGEDPGTAEGTVLRHWRVVAAGHSPLKLMLSPEERAQSPSRFGFRQNQVWSLTMQGVDVTAGIVFDRPLPPDGQLLIELETPLRPVDVRYGGRSVSWSTLETLPMKDGEGEDDEITNENSAEKKTSHENTREASPEIAAGQEIRGSTRRILIHLDGLEKSDAQELQIDAQCRLSLETPLALPRIRIVSDRFFHRETRTALVVTRPLLVRHIEAVDAARTVPGSALERPGRDVFVYQYFHADARLRLELTTFAPKLHCIAATVLESSPGEIGAETTAEFSLAEGHRYEFQCPVTPGWIVDSVKAAGRNEVVDWSIDEKTRQLSVQWKRALVPGEPLRLQIKSRLPSLPETLSLQALNPLRLPETESGKQFLGIDPGCPYHFQEGASIPYLLTVPAPVPSALRTLLDHSGAAILAVDDGTRLLPLALESTQSSFHAEIHGAVTLNRDGAKLTYTLRCTPVEGYMDRLLVVFRPEDDDQWQWYMDEEGERPFQVVPVSYRPPGPPPGLFDPAEEIDDTESPVVRSNEDDGKGRGEKKGDGNGKVDEADKVQRLTSAPENDVPFSTVPAPTAASKSFRAWELQFTSPRSAPFQVTVSRNLSSVPQSGEIALPLAALPLAAEQRGELVVEANHDPGIHIVNHRLEALPFSPWTSLVDNRLDTPVTNVPRNFLQTVRAVFRYDPRKELDQEEGPALLLISADGTRTSTSKTSAQTGTRTTSSESVVRDPAALDGCVWSLQLDSQYQSDGTVRNNAIFLIENVSRESVFITLPEQVAAADIMAVWVDDAHVAWTLETPTNGASHGSSRNGSNNNGSHVPPAGVSGNPSAPPQDGVRFAVDLPVGQRFVALSVEYLHHDEPLTRKRRLKPGYPRIDMPVLSGSWTTWFPPEYDVSERRRAPGSGQSRFRIRAVQWVLGDFDSLSPDRWYLNFFRNEDEAIFHGLAQTLLAAVGEPERIVSGTPDSEPTWAQWFEREDRIREDLDSVVPHIPVRFRIDRRSLIRIGMNASRAIPRDAEGSAPQRGYRALEKCGLSLILLKGGDPTNSEAYTALLTSSLTAAKCRGMLRNLVGERVWLLVPSPENERHRWHRSGVSQPGPSWESVRNRLPKECDWVESEIWTQRRISENNLWPSVSQEVRFSSATAGWTAIELSRSDAERSLYIVHRNTIATYGMIAFLGMLLLTWRRPLAHPLLLLAVLFLLEMATRNVPPCYTPLFGGAFFGTLCSLAFAVIRPAVRHRVSRGRVLTYSGDTTTMSRTSDGTDILDDAFALSTGEGVFSAGTIADPHDSVPGSTVNDPGIAEEQAASEHRDRRRDNPWDKLARQETVISDGLPGLAKPQDNETPNEGKDISEKSGKHGEHDDHGGKDEPGDLGTGGRGDTNGGGPAGASTGPGKPYHFPVCLAVPIVMLSIAATTFIAQGQTVSRTMQNTPPYSPYPPSATPPTTSSNPTSPTTSVRSTTTGPDSATIGTTATDAQTPAHPPGPSSTSSATTSPGPPATPEAPRSIALPEPYKVVIPTEDGVEVDDNYWISEEFLRKIHDAIRRGATSGYRWSIRRAEYLGTLADNPLQRQEILNLRALYDIELENGTATLQVPFLPEVVRWDGNPLQPTVLPTTAEGSADGSEMLTFAVENQRPGEHRLEVVRMHMADRNEEFNRLQLQNISIPKVPGAVLRLTVPPETPPIHVGLSQGAVYPNSVYSPQLVAELGAVDQIRLSWSDRTLLEERMTTDQLFLLRAQPNKEVELQTKFRFHAGNAKVRHLYVEIDPDLQISGQYRLFVNALPSDLIESVRELSDDGHAPAGRRGLTRVTLKEPTGGTISLRADFVVKNFSGIGSMALPRLGAAHTQLGKSWMAVSIDPTLEAEFTPEVADPEILRSFPALWAATGVSAVLQEVPLHIAFDLKNVEDGTLLSIRARKPVYKTRWEQSLLFDETEIRMDARVKIEASTDTFQHSLRVPAEMEIEELTVFDAEGHPLEARWIPASTTADPFTPEAPPTDKVTDKNAAKPTGKAANKPANRPANKTANKDRDKDAAKVCEYAVFLKRPINGTYSMTVRGRIPFAIAEKPARSAIPLPRLGLADALILDESLALYRTSGVVFSFEDLPPIWRKLAADRTEPVFPKTVPLGVYSSLQAPPQTAGKPNEAADAAGDGASHHQGAGNHGAAPGRSVGTSRRIPARSFEGSRTRRPAGPPLSGPSAATPRPEIFETPPSAAVPSRGLAEPASREPVGASVGPAASVSTVHPKTAARSGSQTGAPASTTGPATSGMSPLPSSPASASSTSSSSPGTPTGASPTNPTAARSTSPTSSPVPPPTDPGPTALPTFRLLRNRPRLTGTQVTSLYRRLRRADNNDALSTETTDVRTERETVWEVLTIFDLSVEGGEIDSLTVRFDKECRAISVLGNHGYILDPRESGPIMQLKPSPPAADTLRLEIRCEVGSLADSVVLPKIALDAERVAIRQYVVLPREFLAERYDWSVEQLSPVSPQTAQWILGDEAVFQREEIDRTDPESLEDHRRTKTVYAVVGPDYEAVIRPPGEGAVILLADLTLYLRKDGRLYGLATYDIRGGGEKRVTLRMPEGFHVVHLSSGTNAFETEVRNNRRRYLVELWETLPQRVEVVFEGEIPALRRSNVATLRRWTREPVEMDIPLPRFEEIPIRETLWTLNFEDSARDLLPQITTRAFVRLPKGTSPGTSSEDAPGVSSAPSPGTPSVASRVAAPLVLQGTTTTASPAAEANVPFLRSPDLRLVAFESQRPQDDEESRATLLLFDMARLDHLLRCSETLSATSTPSHADLQAWHSRWGRCWWTLRDETERDLSVYGASDFGQRIDRISLADTVRSPVLSYMASLEAARQPATLVGNTRLPTSALRHLDARHRTVLENLGLVVEDGRLEKDLTHATGMRSLWKMSHFGSESRLFGGVDGELVHLQLVSQPVQSRLIDSVPFHYGIWALILALGILVVNDTPVRRLYRRFPHFWGIALALLIWGVYPESGAGPFLLLLVLLAMLSSPWRKTSPKPEAVAAHWKPS